MKKLLARALLALLALWLWAIPLLANAANVAMNKLTVADVMKKKKELHAFIAANVHPQAKAYLDFLLEKTSLIDGKIQKSGEPLLRPMGPMGASVLFPTKGANLNDPFSIAKIRFLDKVLSTGDTVSGFLAGAEEMFRTRSEAMTGELAQFDHEVGVPTWFDRLNKSAEIARTGVGGPTTELLLATDLRSFHQGTGTPYAIRTIVVPTRFQKRKLLGFSRQGDAVTLGLKDIKTLREFVEGIDLAKGPSLDGRISRLLKVAKRIFRGAEAPDGGGGGQRGLFEVPGEKHDLLWRRDVAKGWGFRLRPHDADLMWDFTLDRVDKLLDLGRFDGTLFSTRDLVRDDAKERYIISDFQKGTAKVWGRFNFEHGTKLAGFFTGG